MRPGLPVLLAAVAALSTVIEAGCRHLAAPSATPVDGAEAPIGAPRPFAALYRVDCCGQSGLLVTLRGDGQTMLVSVAAPPAGTVGEAWLDPGAGWLRGGGERCIRTLPAGFLPLANGAALPLDPHLAALLLSGLVPQEARPVEQRAGWVELQGPRFAVAWKVEGKPRRVTAVEVARTGDAGLLLVAHLSDHHQRVPGRLQVRAGATTAELRLVEWRSAAMVERPAWLQMAPCEAGG